MTRQWIIAACLCISAVAAPSEAEVRGAIEKADALGRELSELMTHADFKAHWADDDSRLIYQISEGRRNFRFYEIDLASGKSSPAFDHEKLAKALADTGPAEVDAARLPLRSVVPAAGSGLVRFSAFSKRWQWDPERNQLEADATPFAITKPEAPDAHRRSGGSDQATQLTIDNSSDEDVELFWLDSSGEAKSYGILKAKESRIISTYAGHAWRIARPGGPALASARTTEADSTITFTGKVEASPKPRSERSPDGRWIAVVRDHNLRIEPASGGEVLTATTDGTRRHAYSGPFEWSPDSKTLAAWRTLHVDERKVHIVQSSPPDQLQPKLITFNYAKPGDEITQRKPVLIDVSNNKATQVPLDDTLYDNPWSIQQTAWAPDSSEFQFLYNARGHQTMRHIGISAHTGEGRLIHEETSKTFIDYSHKTWVHRLPETREILWASERDGFNHLYLIDERAGKVRKQITSGEWNVRRVIDVRKQADGIELLIETVGMDPENPYHSHFGRIVIASDRQVHATRLTHSKGHHEIDFSPGRKWLLGTWSRPDQPPVVELRRVADGELLAELARANDSALRKRGWQPPERFVAKGRDGKTDIHGVIVRPTRFDPDKRYPVVEDIYAGPHDFFTPQRFRPWSGMHAMAELGFIVVKLDGMGTNWRNKAFQDVAWKNLKDSGFPDRIPWIKAAAASRPWMDLSRVGIYGGSAGGQSALSALLHHGDFYHAGVADCGCHDNRMDKIWWNEAWMGWPVDDSYAENSNVTHADKLKGRLMLIVGELDQNVDPASTAQVVAALQKAGKHFDYVPIMNAGHGAAETLYGSFRRAEFLIRHLGAEAETKAGTPSSSPSQTQSPPAP